MNQINTLFIRNYQPIYVQAPAHYRPHAQTIVIYLTQQFLPKDRLQQTMDDVLK